ncbi:hypothetical protein GCM10009856_14500 [Mycolicibacterium llatzerense]
MLAKFDGLTGLNPLRFGAAGPGGGGTGSGGGSAAATPGTNAIAQVAATAPIRNLLNTCPE